MRYECEVCNKVEELSETEAFNSGWDYPPFIGVWGIVSPRTCGDCGMQDTAWWFLTQNMGIGTNQIPENHLATIKRIAKETEYVTISRPVDES